MCGSRVSREELRGARSFPSRRLSRISAETAGEMGRDKRFTVTRTRPCSRPRRPNVTLPRRNGSDRWNFHETPADGFNRACLRGEQINSNARRPRFQPRTAGVEISEVFEESSIFRGNLAELSPKETRVQELRSSIRILVATVLNFETTGMSRGSTEVF